MRMTFLFCFFIPFYSLASTLCNEDADNTCMNTHLGKVEVIDGASHKTKTSSITLNDKVIYTVTSESMMPENGISGLGDAYEIEGRYLTRKSIIGYWEESPCHCEKFFMLDLSGDKPIFSNEFFDSASYYIDWVSWGKEKAVLSLAGKKYQYKNGVVTPIEDKQ